MRIVYVVDTVQPSNGVATSAQRSAAAMRERGHDVRVVATDGEVGHARHGWIQAAAPRREDAFIAAPWHVPLVSLFARPQHFTFARPDRDLLRRAYRDADVVHIWLATPFGRTALDVAQELGVPVSAGFHVQPENISYNIGLGRREGANDEIYDEMRHRFYDDVGHIHCPSRFIADELADHHYRATTHVISNGVTPMFRPGAAREPWTPESGRPCRVMSVGRLSPEKRQDVLIDAVKRSKHRAQIELEIAGRGPRRNILAARGYGMKPALRLTSYPQEALVRELQAADLYVHAADAEIESVACLEAVACGLVPVIAESPRSAASQFALDDRSLFPSGDVDALASALDWWIGNPDERARMAPLYAASAQQYSIARSAELMERMFLDVIADARR